MSRVRIFLIQSVALLAWPALVLYMLKSGNYLVATLCALPLFAVLAAALLPGSETAQFAAVYEFGPSRQKSDTELDYQISLAKWFSVGTVFLPIAHLLHVAFNSDAAFLFLAIFIGYIFGVACLIKLSAAPARGVKYP